jgi:hypothetical protein
MILAHGLIRLLSTSFILASVSYIGRQFKGAKNVAWMEDKGCAINLTETIYI